MRHVARPRGSAPAILASAAAEQERSAALRYFSTPPQDRSERSFRFRIHLHREVRAAVERLFHEKCAYCESRLLPIQAGLVEHFRPKARALNLDGAVDEDHYWWLAGEWTNLLLVCEQCNRLKRNRFPVKGRRAQYPATGRRLRAEGALLLDPCADRPEEHLVFDELGLVGSDTERGRATIEVLGLNRDSLVADRRAAVTAAKALFQHTLERLSEADAGEVRAALGGLMDPARPYAGCLAQFLRRWLDELTSTEKAAVEPLSKDVAKKAVLVTEQDSTETVERFKSHMQRQQAYSVESGDDAHVEKYFSGAKRIEWIEIRNFRAIERLRLDFPAPRSENEPWLSLLGENATGKSSVLQAVALALMGEQHCQELGLDGSTLLRRGARNGSVQVKLTNVPTPVKVTFRRGSPAFTYGTKQPLVLLLGYGATRLLQHPHQVPGDEPSHIRIKNLFDPTAPLADIEHWLLDEALVEDDRFAGIANALAELLMLDQDERFVRTDGKIKAQVQGETVHLEQLSAGFQSMVALCGDIMKSLVEKWGGNLEDAEGVVLLDEIEAHLHPTWKIEIVERLRRTFPQVAFLVSTHDPLCLKGLFEGEIAVLQRDDSRKIVAITDVPPVNDLRADQILTSFLFGMHSTRGNDATAAIARYAELFGKARRTEAEEAELEQLRARLEPTMTAQQRPGQQRVEQAIMQTLTQAAPVRRPGTARRPGGPPTPEELELRRQLDDLLAM